MKASTDSIACKTKLSLAKTTKALVENLMAVHPRGHEHLLTRVKHKYLVQLRISPSASQGVSQHIATNGLGAPSVDLLTFRLDQLFDSTEWRSSIARAELTVRS